MTQIAIDQIGPKQGTSNAASKCIPWNAFGRHQDATGWDLSGF